MIPSIIIWMLFALVIGLLFGLSCEVGRGDREVFKSLWMRIVDNLKRIWMKHHGS